MKYASLRDNQVAYAFIASMKGSFWVLFDLNISTHLLIAAVFSMCHSPSILFHPDPLSNTEIWHRLI